MDDYLKVTAGVIICLILCLTLNKNGKDFAVLITVAACCMIVAAAASYLEPVLSFLKKLEQLGNFDAEILQIMLKSVAVALLAEITALICADAGNASLGKALQILASVVILWLATPLFNSLLNIVDEILGAL